MNKCQQEFTLLRVLALISLTVTMAIAFALNFRTNKEVNIVREQNSNSTSTIPNLNKYHTPSTERGCGDDPVDIDSFTPVPAAGSYKEGEMLYDKYHVYVILPQEFLLQCLSYIDRESFHVVGFGKDRAIELMEGLTDDTKNMYFSDKNGVYVIDYGVISKIAKSEKTFNINQYEELEYP